MMTNEHLQKENTFLDDWAAKVQGFIRDGIVNHEFYWNSKIRILLLLKEVNGGENWDLRKFLQEGGRKQTWDNVTRWIIGINDLERDIPWAELESITKDQRISALQQIAVVNVKKTSGGHTSVSEQIAAAAINNGEMLCKQIDMYQPDIIICGGTSGSYFDSITRYSNPDWKQTKHGIWYVVEPTGRIIVEYSHPEARVKDCLLYYGLVDAVREIIYKPINLKIQAWIDYELNKPKGNYNTHKQEHDEYRQKNDLDCILTDGNLCADTIFSLWLPLRFVLVRINDYKTLSQYGDINNKVEFLKAISGHIPELLPLESTVVLKLIRLFDLGQKRCNVMILKDRRMQRRGDKPYYDYMPYFLSECFEDGDFSSYFTSGDQELKEWIQEEKLEMFFKEDRIEKDTIKDLAGTGDITKGVPQDMNLLLDNYIGILEQRKRRL